MSDSPTAPLDKTKIPIKNAVTKILIFYQSMIAFPVKNHQSTWWTPVNPIILLPSNITQIRSSLHRVLWQAGKFWYLLM
jgi:hypothetical protein